MNTAIERGMYLVVATAFFVGGVAAAQTQPEANSQVPLHADEPTKPKLVVPESVGDDASQPTPVVPDSLGEDAVEAQLEAVPLEEFDTRSQDQVWTISSRSVGSMNAPTDSLRMRRRIDGDHWVDESASSFLRPAKPGVKRHTVIFVHGNRTPRNKAIRRGLQTYDQLFLEWKKAPSVRFVIWMWPGDQIPGQIRDVRVKAGRADQHAFHLARLLTQMPDDAQVSIIGYSFGGRLAIGAMHLLGGGTICGRRLETNDNRIPTVNLALVAPAIRNDCLLTTRSRAPTHINHLFLLFNSRDQYLKLYRFLRLDNFRPALGNTGICGVNQLSMPGDRIVQHNSSQGIGRDHDYLEYVVDERIEAKIRQNIFQGHPSSTTHQHHQ